MCESTLQVILSCNCSLSLSSCKIGLQCNLRFLSTTISQGSVVTRVNYGKIFNDFFIVYLLLSVIVKEFWRSVRIWQSYGKKYSGTFFPDTVYMWNNNFKNFLTYMLQYLNNFQLVHFLLVEVLLTWYNDGCCS